MDIGKPSRSYRMHQAQELLKHKFHQNVVKSLASKLGIPHLRSGNATIRDNRGWRIDESIEYCWLIGISKSFVGWCWLYSIKFNQNSFRKKSNPDELIQGIFTVDKEGKIGEFYQKHRPQDYVDKIRRLTSYDLFDANRGLTLDGIGYEYFVFAPNAEIKISLNNPNSENWKVWENEVWRVGRELSLNSGIQVSKELFA
ncbi:hypothetical protein LVD17_07440 [Fulvivirga ulvae]|uniref:hypothetical protein n=1 Tax=Fulvivirga ulvae TaxID=2904245 RepID=UPI001F2213D8|nr:hypothetical protein [Fulvivirga ulvae]UII33652.1 hypothetical protein LVD17_07440 [Fulvivirga ulvae]